MLHWRIMLRRPSSFNHMVQTECKIVFSFNLKYVFCFSVHGGWSDWGDWGLCSETCGPGIRDRSRKCDSPLPDCGGNHCPGLAVEPGSCNLRCCPGVYICNIITFTSINIMLILMFIYYKDFINIMFIFCIHSDWLHI